MQNFALAPGEFALIVYAILFGICILVAGIAMAMLFSKDPSKAIEGLKTFYDSGNGLRIITVLAVLGTTVVLAMAGKLEQGTLSLLSGVAGFVLGGLVATRKGPPDQGE